MTTSASPRPVPWVSFVADDGDTWLFDLSFFSSNWNCIFGHGCAGIEHEMDVEGHRGCCSYGAHFADEDDLRRVMTIAAALPEQLWQHHEHRPAETEDVEALAAALTEVDEDGDNRLAVLPAGVSLQELVNGLNALGVGPRDMITILQAVKASGALQAEIEVM